MKNGISADQHGRNQVYVHRVNREKGWFDKPVSFLEAMALLMTEVTEAYEAWVEDGLGKGNTAFSQMRSELADCYIRLLDDFSRFPLNFGRLTDVYRYSFRRPARLLPEHKLWYLIVRIRDIIEAYRVEGLDDQLKPGVDTAMGMAYFYLELEAACDDLGVDLQKEFQKKMQVNEGRPYRHGGKHA